MPSPTLKDWLEKGPFTLALSSSFFGFFAHCGVVSAIWNQQLAPRKITGASAGALVGGALASGLAPEAVQEILFGVKKEDFWDPSWGPGLLRGQKFLELLEKYFVSNFEQASIPFEAAVFDLFACKTQFLHKGSLPKAIAASCAVPLMFRPVRIGTRFYFDGGVFHKSGINLTHSNERILCVFLQNDGLADAYEWGRSLGKLGEQQRVLRLKNLPQVHYNSLSKGALAFSEALKRTERALESPLSPGILDF